MYLKLKMEIRDHKVDLDWSFDSFWDEITDEWSPNSIKDYTTFCSQDGNVLVSNKGKIKDIYSFKFELLEWFRKHELVNSVWTPVSFILNKIWIDPRSIIIY